MTYFSHAAFSVSTDLGCSHLSVTMVRAPGYIVILGQGWGVIWSSRHSFCFTSEYRQQEMFGVCLKTEEEPSDSVPTWWAHTLSETCDNLRRFYPRCFQATVIHRKPVKNHVCWWDNLKGFLPESSVKSLTCMWSAAELLSVETEGEFWSHLVSSSAFISRQVSLALFSFAIPS